jgi:hypothetical protein
MDDAGHSARDGIPRRAPVHRGRTFTDRKTVRRAPVVYTVEIAPTPPDPTTASRVAAWLRKKLNG